MKTTSCEVRIRMEHLLQRSRVFRFACFTVPPICWRRSPIRDTSQRRLRSWALISNTPSMKDSRITPGTEPMLSPISCLGCSLNESNRKNVSGHCLPSRLQPAHGTNHCDDEEV